MDLTHRDELSALLRRLDEAREDQDAWRALHTAAWPFVVAVASRRLRGTPAILEDVAQEVFMRLVRYAPFSRLQDPDRFRAYLATVTKHVADTQLGVLLHRREKEQPVEQPGGLVSPKPGPDKVAEGNDLAQNIRRQLTAAERRMLKLLLEGCELPEMAAILGIRYQAAGTRLSRLRSKIQKLIQDQELGADSRTSL